MSTGTNFTKMARKHFGIGPRTRQHRNGLALKAEIIEAIETSNLYPGYYNEQMSTLFGAALPVARSYRKHVDGGRIDPMTSYEIEMMSPWQFSAFVGEMIDAGISNNYEGEMFFRSMRKELVSA
ncbi:hypothetical protein D6T65_04925 [Arthrobacter frigidicola]|nr:hypothetical protein D6T65_04925 [Arthrobacter frigidicola]